MSLLCVVCLLLQGELLVRSNQSINQSVSVTHFYLTEGAATTEDQTCFLPQDVKHGKVALYEDEGLCYMFFKDDGVTWSEINATCAAHGGFPVSIKVCLLSSFES